MPHNNWQTASAGAAGRYSLFDTFSDFLFIAVGICRVKHSIAILDCCHNRVFAGLSAKHKCTEADKRHRNAIILKQRDAAYHRLDEAKATVKYMDDKVAHYESILLGNTPDDTNPKNWTAENRPKH